MPVWWPFAVLSALVLSAGLTPWWGRLAARLGLIDEPRAPRNLHTRPTPFFGGVSIFVAFAVPVIAVLLFSQHLTSGDIGERQYLGMFLGSVILLLGGLLDDAYQLKPYQSVAFPILAALVAVGLGVGVSKVTNPFGGAFELGPLLSASITLVWLLGMTYTSKLLDGQDGLATGIAGVGAIMISLLALSQAFFQPDVALLALTFAAAVAGFWLWNLPPAQIFLGESGSTYLGFMLGVLAVIAGSKLATMLLVVGVPALDVVLVAGRRLRQGKKVTEGDRTHLHHLLLAAGFKPWSILGLYVGVASLFGITSLIFASWQKLIALGILAIVVSLGVEYLYKRYGKNTYDSHSQ